MRQSFFVFCFLGLVMPSFSQVARAQSGNDLTPLQRDLIAYVDRIRPELIAINQDIWTFAELGLQEYRSAARLVKVLKESGFRVRKGVSDMPTAFVAEYGEGKPVIGILAEYDALPGLSQRAAGDRQPFPGQKNGHACGHCALGTAAVAAALAVKEIYDRHGLHGTIRVYGTPAEETVIGKVYMTLDHQFDDLDACLHWHPATKNRILYSTSKALISAKFRFTGLAAHASGSPDKGRSALDAVELMNVGVNYMREHIKETSRIHYVITNGGGQPNVIPAEAEVWYFVRANRHEDAERQFDWICDIAEGAAKMTRTKVSVRVDTDCHELIPNLPLSRLMARMFAKVGPPKFDDADRLLARQLQTPLRTDFGLKESKPLREDIEKLPQKPYPATGGSTDVGDISWHVPTSGINVVCFAAGSPGHSWQNVAAIGSPIGHKGMIVASKILGLAMAELLIEPAIVAEAKKDFQERTKGMRYTTRIPSGQKPPRTIR